jgi:hypothetical protein
MNHKIELWFFVPIYIHSLPAVTLRKHACSIEKQPALGHSFYYFSVGLEAMSVNLNCREYRQGHLGILSSLHNIWFSHSSVFYALQKKIYLIVIIIRC